VIEMNRSEIDRLLDGSSIGRLSMADALGRPYTIPLPFCWLDGAIYFRLALTGRKGAVLAANNRVCFEVDTFSEAFDQVSIEASQPAGAGCVLSLLIEKDFECLHSRAEGDSDAFPNPRIGG
jgi:hypothetical protein